MDENQNQNTENTQEGQNAESQYEAPVYGEPVFSTQAPPSPVFADLPNNIKTMGMLCHLLALAGLTGIPLLNIVGPLIIWLLKKDEHPFIADQGRESLNFQITLMIAGLIASPTMCLFGIGFFLLIAIGIFGLVFVIIASISASGGTAYRYPMTLRLVK